MKKSKASTAGVRPVTGGDRVDQETLDFKVVALRRIAPRTPKAD